MDLVADSTGDLLGKRRVGKVEIINIKYSN